MPEMPTLGPPPKTNPMGSVLLVALVAGLSGGGVYWWSHRNASKEIEALKAQAAANAQNGGVQQQAAVQQQVAAAQPQQVAQQQPGNQPVAAQQPGVQQPALQQPPLQQPLAAAENPSGLKSISIHITGPLETAVNEAAGKDIGPALTQVLTRSLVWWIEMPGDLKRNDQIDVVYEERPNDEPVIHAVRFTSEKLGKTVAAYRYKAPSDSYPRFYQADGTELELRLKNAPLDDYEQVTSLLRDGRRHKGVDFKTPVGTPVKATFSGTITRKNWNFRGNGNSIEVAIGGGRKVMFLHLSEIPKTVQVGQHVTQGEVLAHSGNTGHSFAPHLHYQMVQGEDRILDPFEVHETYRRSIASADAAGFQVEQKRLEGLFPAAVAARTP